MAVKYLNLTQILRLNHTLEKMQKSNNVAASSSKISHILYKFVTVQQSESERILFQFH